MGRLAAVDVVKGAGVVGIVVTHALLLGAGVSLGVQAGSELARWVVGATFVLVDGRLTVVFAALFGVGLAFQARQPTRFWLLRAALIGLVGMVQATWFPLDILGQYAVAMLLVLAVRRWPVRWVVVLGAALTLLSAVLVPTMVTAGAAQLAGTRAALASVNGWPLPQIAGAFLGSWVSSLADPVMPFVVAAVVLGYAFGRSGMVRRADGRAVRVLSVLALVCAVPLTVVMVWAHAVGAVGLVMALFVPSGMVGGWVVILWALRLLRAPVGWLASAGANSLTVYVAENALLSWGLIASGNVGRFSTGGAYLVAAGVMVSVSLLAWAAHRAGARLPLERLLSSVLRPYRASGPRPVAARPMP